MMFQLLLTRMRATRRSEGNDQLNGMEGIVIVLKTQIQLWQLLYIISPKYNLRTVIMLWFFVRFV